MPLEKQNQPDLSELITSYIKFRRPILKEEISFYKSPKTLETAIAIASSCIRGDGKKHKHQQLISPALLKTASAILKKKVGVLTQAKTFAEIFEVVQESIGVIKGIGLLTVYDIALRIGFFQNRLPQKVYLHAGVIKGAKKLGLATKTGILSIDEIPREIQILQVFEIEDFLCHSRDDFKENPRTI